MRIAYFSPFPPERSGVADFSYELIAGFCKYTEYVQIDLFYPENMSMQKIPGLTHIYPLTDFDDKDTRACYDHYVYHVGNNITYHKWIIETFKKYPGIIELHDLSLHYYLAEDSWARGDIDEYVRIMKYCHGARGEYVALQFINSKIRAPWETSSDVFTVNKHLIDIAKAVIVHSDFAKQNIKGIRSDATITTIPLHTSDIVSDYAQYKIDCRKALGIGAQDIVMGTFGYATTAKRVQQIVEAFRLYLLNHREFKHQIRLYIVGKLEDKQVISQIKQYGIENAINIKGFVTLDELKIHMGACDFCFNLRFPSQGESSASFHRMLGMGKPIIITKIAAFEEYPDSFTLKVSHGESEVEEIYRAICLLADNSQLLRRKEKDAYQYAVNNCSLDTNVRKYIRFFSDLSKGSFQEDYIDLSVDRMIYLGLDNGEFIDHLANKLSIA